MHLQNLSHHLEVKKRPHLTMAKNKQAMEKRGQKLYCHSINK